jgi:hypothetical protein
VSTGTQLTLKFVSNTTARTKKALCNKYHWVKKFVRVHGDTLVNMSHTNDPGGGGWRRRDKETSEPCEMGLEEVRGVVNL